MLKLSAPRRRPADGGYARGAETREKIIEAAFVVFGDEGYVRASTRRIAAEAGVNPPALQYYFGSKEGLHRACGQYIIDQLTSVMDPALAQARQALAEGGSKLAIDALCALVDALAGVAIAKSEAKSWSRFLSRLQADDAGPAFGMTQERISDPLRAVATALVAASLRLPADSHEVRLRAAFLLSQLSALHVHGASTLAMLGWSDFSGPRTDMVKAVLRDQTRAALSGPDAT